MLSRASRILALVIAVFTVVGMPDLSAQASTAHTVKAVVRPVTASGQPAPGWTVHREQGTLEGCDSESPSAVSNDIDVCWPMYLYAASCWKSSGRSVLCYQMPGHRLARITLRGRFHHGAPVRHVRPQLLRLYDGQSCSIHVGGAWPPAPGHPRWPGYYSCGRGFLYGPDGGDGINRSHPVWTVRESHHGTLVTRRVRTATYVGTRG